MQSCLGNLSPSQSHFPNILKDGNDSSVSFLGFFSPFHGNHSFPSSPSHGNSSQLLAASHLPTRGIYPPKLATSRETRGQGLRQWKNAHNRQRRQQNVEWETGRQPDVDPTRTRTSRDTGAAPGPELLPPWEKAPHQQEGKSKTTKMKCLFPPGVTSVRCRRQDAARPHGHLRGDGVPSSPHAPAAHPSSGQGCPALGAEGRSSSL